MSGRYPSDRSWTRVRRWLYQGRKEGFSRADHLKLGYPGAFECRGIVGITTLVTALAMNRVHTGTQYP